MSSAVEINNLSVVLDSNKVLDDISADIPSGKIVGLLGPSGSGKTTLIRAILGLQKSSQGQVKALGLSAGKTELHAKIGYVTQSLSVYPDLTIQENIDYFASLVRADSFQSGEILKELEIVQQKDRLVRNLSGGQKARVSLAVALLGRPELILLDEPTVGLDPVLRQKLWDKFKQLSNSGVTLIVTSHVMDEAEKCDDILFIREGKLLAAGSRKSILKQARADTMENAFLNFTKRPAS